MDASFVTSAFNETHFPPSDIPEIAFAGRSNVGKSSLLNVLVNRRKLARTSSTPGRTQAINFFITRNGGLYLVDLPGYGFAKVPLSVKASWKKMVDAYLSTRKNLKAVVVIVDIRRELSEGDLINTTLNPYRYSLRQTNFHGQRRPQGQENLPESWEAYLAPGLLSFPQKQGRAGMRYGNVWKGLLRRLEIIKPVTADLFVQVASLYPYGLGCL
jgi:ribosome biogenesis GTP-binding protein YsxC/EngB